MVIFSDAQFRDLSIISVNHFIEVIVEKEGICFGPKYFYKEARLPKKYTEASELATISHMTLKKLGTKLFFSLITTFCDISAHISRVNFYKSVSKHTFHPFVYLTLYEYFDESKHVNCRV